MLQSQPAIDALKRLRRHARILTGCPRSTDTALLVTLKELAPHGLSYNCRLQLFKTFTHIWNGPVGDHVRFLRSRAEAESLVEKRVADVPSHLLQLVLLEMLEGFAETEIAEIMDVDVSAIAGMRQEALQAVMRACATHVLVFVEEDPIRSEIVGTMKSLGHTVSCLVERRDMELPAQVCAEPGLLIADDSRDAQEALKSVSRDNNPPLILVANGPTRSTCDDFAGRAFFIKRPVASNALAATALNALFFGTRPDSMVPIEFATNGGLPDRACA